MKRTITKYGVFGCLTGFVIFLSHLSFAKNLSYGILISFCVGIGIGVADFIYTEFLNPNFYTEYAEKLSAEGKADEVIEMTSTLGALFMLVLVVVIGFMISLISALVLQRKSE